MTHPVVILSRAKDPDVSHDHLDRFNRRTNLESIIACGARHPGRGIRIFKHKPGEAHIFLSGSEGMRPPTLMSEGFRLLSQATLRAVIISFLGERRNWFLVVFVF